MDGQEALPERRLETSKFEMGAGIPWDDKLHRRDAEIAHAVKENDGCLVIGRVRQHDALPFGKR
jgi:hypothetical protein